MQAHPEAVEVEKRQRVDEDVARGPPPDLDRATPLGQEVAVVEESPFRAPGGARGVEDCGGTLGGEWRHCRLLCPRQILEGDDASSEPPNDLGPVPVRDDGGGL